MTSLNGRWPMATVQAIIPGNDFLLDGAAIARSGTPWTRQRSPDRVRGICQALTEELCIRIDLPEHFSKIVVRGDDRISTFQDRLWRLRFHRRFLGRSNLANALRRDSIISFLIVPSQCLSRSDPQEAGRYLMRALQTPRLSEKDQRHSGLGVPAPFLRSIRRGSLVEGHLQRRDSSLL